MAKAKTAKLKRRNLKPLKKEAKQKPFAVVDIETREWIHHVVSGAFAPDTGFRHFKTLKGLLSFCFEHYQGKRIFAHFGGRFDFLFFIDEALKQGWQIENLITRGTPILTFELVRGEERITFCDSSALLPFGLKRLCENFKVEHPKQDIDYSKITKITPKLLKYLEHDCKGLYEVLEKFYSWPLIAKAGPATTLAGQALRVFRTMMKEEIPALNKRVDRYVRASYFGGRTEIFKPIFESESEEITCYDVNSLYPFQMWSHDMPVRFLHFTDEYDPYNPGFYDCRVEVPESEYVPALGILHEGKYVFPTGTFTGRFASCEIEYARSLGYKIEVTRGAVFQSGGRIFREYVETLYEIREASEKDSVDNTLAKLLMNSLYGRFALRLTRENIVFDDGSAGLKPWREVKLKGKTARLMKREVELQSFNNVAIPAWITAQGRIHMHRSIYKPYGEHLFYTDTDSGYLACKVPSGKGLGELKEEFSEKSACFLLPKTYVAGKKVVMKGFEKKKCANFTFEDFKNFLEGDLKYLRITTESRFATLSTALKSGKLVTMTKTGTKEIRSKYDKRILFKTKNGSWDSRAIHLVGEKQDGKETDS
jgi:hypothetical protein